MRSDFEKYTQDKINNHPTEVDLESLWAEVEPHVRKKKKRRFIWIFLLGLGLSASGAGWLIWSNILESSKINPELTTNENSDFKQKKLDKSNLEIETIEKEINLGNKSINKKEEVQLSVQIDSFKKVKSPPLKRWVPFSKVSKKIDTQSINTSNNNHSNQLLDTLAISDNPQMLENLTKSSSTNEFNFSPKLLPNFPIFLKIKDTLSLYRIPEFPRKGKENNPPKKKKWAIGIQGGYYQSFVNLDTIKPSQSTYLDNRKNSENTLETLNFGIGVSYHFENDFYIKWSYLFMW